MEPISKYLKDMDKLSKNRKLMHNNEIYQKLLSYTIRLENAIVDARDAREISDIIYELYSISELDD